MWIFEIFLPVLIVSAMRFALGMLWYSSLFGKRFIELRKVGLVKEQQEKMMNDFKNIDIVPIFVQSFAFGFLYSLIYRMFWMWCCSVGLCEGKVWGLFLILAGELYTNTNSVLYNNKPWELFAIDGGYGAASALLTFLVYAIF